MANNSLHNISSLVSDNDVYHYYFSEEVTVEKNVDFGTVAVRKPSWVIISIPLLVHSHMYYYDDVSTTYDVLKLYY